MTDITSGNRLHFHEPWFKTEDNGKYFEEELKRELVQSHSLYGKNVTAVAFRKDQDEVLFKVEGLENEYAVVHLTYSKESDPRWPHVEFYKDWTTVYQKCIVNDHKEWLEEK